MVRLHDIMTVDPVAVSPEATIREAAELMAAEHVSGLPVVSGSRLMGIVSVSDIVQFDVDRPGRAARDRGESSWDPGQEVWPADQEDESPAAFYTDLRGEAATDLVDRFGSSSSGSGLGELDEYRVEEIMTRELLTMAPDTDVREAARRMLEADVHRVLVVEEDRLVGVASTTDMMKAVAQYGIAG